MDWLDDAVTSKGEISLKIGTGCGNVFTLSIASHLLSNPIEPLFEPDQFGCDDVERRVQLEQLAVK